MSTFTFENGNQIYQRTRLQIGPLYLSAQSYEARSTIDSKEYVSSGPITSISFTADEAFPEEYSTEDTPLDASAFITYSLIIGTGEYKITPSNRGGSDPFKYYINSELLEDARQVLIEDGAGFIDVDEPITTWKLRAKLKRPSNMPESTPVITGYRFTYTYE